MSIVEEYYVDLLNSDDGLNRRLETSYGGRITLNVNRPIRGGGKINIVNDGEPIDWMNARFKVWYQRLDVEQPPMALGVFVPTSPDYKNLPERSVYSIGLHDKTQRLAQQALPAAIAVPAGTVITDEIVRIIQMTGETSISVTPSDAVAKSTMFFKAGTTLLRVVNDLLTYINYFSIWVDGDGVFRGVPYIRPQDRPIARVFQKGKDSIHLPTWGRYQDILGVPNEVILLTDGDSEEEGLVGTKRNENIDSPYSIPNRNGVVISHVEEGIEAADQATIDGLAERRLISLSSPSSTIEIEHRVVPYILNDVVRFISADIDKRATVERLDFTMRPGSLCSATWREVVDV